MAISRPTIQGGTRLVFDSVRGVTNVVESMHETIAGLPPPWMSRPYKNGRAHGQIASSVYTAIRGTTGLLRAGTDQVFSLMPDTITVRNPSAAEVRTVAALNGACGDHLESTNNPLAIGMGLLTTEREVPAKPVVIAAEITKPSPHLVVLVHGLGLSELSWRRKGLPGLGNRLQDKLGHTTLYLRYNTGRHISTNGRDFSQLLTELCDAWPVPIESLSIIGHSMGGLVVRSACHYAQEEKREWREALRRIVFLGTPHHGAPLEQAGHAFDMALQKFPYLAPLALGRHRSVGVKDLRHGNLLDEDWLGVQPHQAHRDNRKPVPLLPGVEYHFAVATLGKHPEDPLGEIMGDLLVRFDSAIGSHKNKLKKLQIEPGNCRVFHEKNHFDLLDDRQVHETIMRWFEP